MTLYQITWSLATLTHLFQVMIDLWADRKVVPLKVTVLAVLIVGTVVSFTGIE